MAIEDFFDHHCDIYHILRSDKSPGYGLPSSPSFSYPDFPSLQRVPCHFGVKSAAVTIVQTEPNANYEAKIKLTLPAGTDIRLNDKIVDCDTGYEYTADIPRNIRGHHTAVSLQRKERQKPL